MRKDGQIDQTINDVTIDARIFPNAPKRCCCEYERLADYINAKGRMTLFVYVQLLHTFHVGEADFFFVKYE